jgi:hypothetical protein
MVVGFLGLPQNSETPLVGFVHARKKEERARSPTATLKIIALIAVFWPDPMIFSLRQ